MLNDVENTVLAQPEPTWEVAELFPLQGEWSEDDYLALAQNTNRLIELADGRLEVLPMPLPYHQLIVMCLLRALDAFVLKKGLGLVLPAPLPVRLFPKTIREPDITFFRSGRLKNLRKTPDGADLAIEVVSEGPKSRKRDLKTKRREYARAGIAEYWIVDPELFRITILRLDGDQYQVHGEYGAGQTARSLLLARFQVKVNDVFAAGGLKPPAA